MNGSGCKTCPVKPCHTLHYRGSYCAEQRAKFGLGDPQTNGDRIRGMTDEELAEVIMCPYGSEPDICCTKGTCLDCCEKWLKEPAEVNNGQSNDQK